MLGEFNCQSVAIRFCHGILNDDLNALNVFMFFLIRSNQYLETKEYLL